MSMCCSISSTQSWFHEPIVPSKEACKLAIFTTIAILAIGLATYCYFYGTTPGYNEIFAYCIWGITGGAVLCTLISYVARAILSREFVRQRQKETIRAQESAKQEALKSYIFGKFFPNTTLESLPIFSTNLLGLTGYFDEDKALEPTFMNGLNVIRGQQSNRPFLGIHLAIHGKDGSKTSARLLIAPNPNGKWYAHASSSIAKNIFSLLNADTPECRVFIDWIDGILNGQERLLLQFDENWLPNSPQSHLIEKADGPKVSLWKD